MSLIKDARRRFHTRLMSEPTGYLTQDENGVISIADSSNSFSKEVAKLLVANIGEARICSKASGQTAGNQFEIECKEFIQETFLTLSELRPGKWDVRRATDRSGVSLENFEQYSHLHDLAQALERNSALSAALGNDYTITPDIIICRKPEVDELINQRTQIVDSTFARKTGIRLINNSSELLHASISCKWTIRSDRAQNSRSEALNLIRNRKGRVPHIVVITAEPTPSRIASIALGTGDIDCVYHFALPELYNSLKKINNEEALSLFNIMVDGKRLKDISDLPFDLAI